MSQVLNYWIRHVFIILTNFGKAYTSNLVAEANEWWLQNDKLAKNRRNIYFLFCNEKLFQFKQEVIKEIVFLCLWKLFWSQMATLCMCFFVFIIDCYSTIFCQVWYPININWIFESLHTRVSCRFILSPLQMWNILLK